MIDQELVSICIPTYNRAHMVNRAIESVLNQTYPNIEIIVVDDCSTDTTQDLVALYNDPRLTYVKNPRNIGQFPSFNRCIELSNGKYIHILHSDDYIDSNFTKTCVEFIKSHPNVMMTFSSARLLSDNKEEKIAVSDHDIIYLAPEGFRNILMAGNNIICPSVMMNRQVYDSVGFFPCEYPYAGDFYQWLRITRNFDVAFVANAILFYRQGEHSESFQYLEKTPLGYVDIINVYFRVIEELGDDLASYRCELNKSLRRHMQVCLKAGIWQSDLMKSYSSLIFIGFALNLWTLIRPDQIVAHIKKIFDFLIIMAEGFLLLLPGGGFVLRRISGLKQKMVSLLPKFASSIK